MPVTKLVDAEVVEQSASFTQEISFSGRRLMQLIVIYTQDAQEATTGMTLTILPKVKDPDPDIATVYTATDDDATVEKPVLAQPTYDGSEVTLTATISGTPTPAEEPVITINDPALPGGTVPITYTVQALDTNEDIAAGFTSLINGDSDLSEAGITATSLAEVVTIVSNSETTLDKTNSANTTITLSGSPSYESVTFIQLDEQNFCREYPADFVFENTDAVNDVTLTVLLITS
jgi:hypothetical protein